MDNESRYPKSLTAPVDEDTHAWFQAQAEAEDRTIGAHLRRLIIAHRREVEKAKDLGARFAVAIERDSDPLTPRAYVGIPDPDTTVTWPHDDPSDDESEGVI